MTRDTVPTGYKLTEIVSHEFDPQELKQVVSGADCDVLQGITQAARGSVTSQELELKTYLAGLQGYIGVFLIGGLAYRQAGTYEPRDIDILIVDNLPFTGVMATDYSSGAQSENRVVNATDEYLTSIGFETRRPPLDRLPRRYAYDRAARWVMRAAPPEEAGLLPIDIVFMNLTGRSDPKIIGLEDYLDRNDLDNAGNTLPRLPLFDIEFVSVNESPN